MDVSRQRDLLAVYRGGRSKLHEASELHLLARLQLGTNDAADVVGAGRHEFAIACG